MRTTAKAANTSTSMIGAAVAGGRVGGRQHELLPEPVTVHSGEFGGEPVDLAEALHPDEERLVVIEAGGLQLGHLVTQVALQLVEVGIVDRTALGERGAPFADSVIQL